MQHNTIATMDYNLWWSSWGSGVCFTHSELLQNHHRQQKISRNQKNNAELDSDKDISKSFGTTGEADQLKL